MEIAKTLRRYPWIVEVVIQRPMSILHPYAVEVYVARDRSETCLSDLVEGVLRPKRSREGDKARTGI